MIISNDIIVKTLLLKNGRPSGFSRGGGDREHTIE